MSVVKYRRAAVVALAFSLGAAACGGDDVLGTPDVAACTAGTLTAGKTDTSAVTAESCLMWHDYDYELYRAESWTLRTEANTAYIVRAKALIDGSGDTTFYGDVSVFARNAAGDPVFATGYWSHYGTVSSDNGRSTETIFTSAKPTTVSIRVSSYAGYEGPYAIELIACPMLKLTVGAPAVTQEFTADDCALLSTGGQLPNPTPVRFWSFDADADVSYTATFTRTAGTSNIFGRLRGPGLDFGCYTGACIASSTSTGAGPYSLIRTPTVAGNYTLAILQQTAGTLTASAQVVTTPVVVMAATDSPR